jgi:oligoendopeptidase F
MFTSLPQTSEAFEQFRWSEIESWYRELTEITLTQETLLPWMAQWSQLCALVDETINRHGLATTQDTADEERARRKQRFIDEIYTPLQPYEQRIKKQLLASGLEPEGFAIPLRNLQAEAALYRKENLPLLNEDKALSNTYMQIGGSMTVTWEDKEVPLTSLFSVLANPDRTQRERVWHAMEERRSQERETLNVLWTKKMQVRQQIARNTGYASYREYRWQQLLRFDYTPTESKAFHALVERVLLPASQQIWENRRKRLGVEKLRPWDMSVDGRASESPRRISDMDALLNQCSTVFHRIDPQLGNYFETMLQEHLLDLEERPNKAPGGYNQPLEVKHRPFIFGHANSVRQIIRLIFHEAGHAFHVFETASLPYIHQRKEEAIPLEFAEVASTSMEFIGAMYLQQAGLCSEREAALLRIQHLENMLANYLPEFILGDAFQHWIYDHPEQATDPQQCSQKWAELRQRYQPAIDWSGLETELRYGWQKILHFYCYPLYVIEYAFAAIGALQIWQNYLHDPQTTLRQYRHALSLGATRTVPELYAAAGARFAFDEEIFQQVIQLITQTVAALERHI